MKRGIGLVALAVAGGVVPAGLGDMAHAGVVVGVTAIALALLVAACLVAPMLTGRSSGTTRAKTTGAPFHPTVPRLRSPARGI